MFFGITFLALLSVSVILLLLLPALLLPLLSLEWAVSMYHLSPSCLAAETSALGKAVSVSLSRLAAMYIQFHTAALHLGSLLRQLCRL